MEPAAILDQLTHEEDLPRTALLAASAQRTEMVPLFLEEIEKYLVASASERGEPTPLFFIFHLLGEWRETSAYRPLARLLRCPEEQLEAALGWSTTETAHRIMAAVCDGDPQPIYDIILDAEADEYVRSRMCEALAMLVLQGTLERDRVVHFLRDCWLNLQPRDVCFVWNGWQSAIAMLGLVELKDIAKEVFDRQFVDPGWLEYEHFERDLEFALENPSRPWQGHRDEYAPFGNAVEEFSSWYCFSEKHKQDREKARRTTAEPAMVATTPLVNAFRDIGRNDPCPCGSGKKFKKCCLNNGETDALMQTVKARLLHR